MKPVRPNEVPVLSSADVALYIAGINQSLMQPWGEDERSRNFSAGSFGNTQREREVTLRAFRAVGWVITLRDDQRDGTYYTIERST